MIPYTDQMPAVCVIVRTAGLPRFVGFEMSLEGVYVPVGSFASRAISANLAGTLNEIIDKTAASVRYFWVMDDDHQFDAMLLLRLLAHDRPVVNGLTCMNKPPYHTVIYKGEVTSTPPCYAPEFERRARETLRALDDMRQVGLSDTEPSAIEALRALARDAGYYRGNRKYVTYGWRELDSLSGLLPVYACGLAGMLIRRDVFEQIPPPWFELGRTNPEEIGEDVWFCEKLRRAGIPIVVDLDSVFGHFAPAAAWPTRREDGTWTIRLQWENGQNIVINRPDLPLPSPVPEPKPEVKAIADRGGDIVQRAREIMAREACSYDAAFAEAMRETLSSSTPASTPAPMATPAPTPSTG